MISSTPKARIITNIIISQTFKPRQGMPQGCPLSPMLFVFLLKTVEPMTTLIRENHNIKGIAAPVMEMKISLFADDILLTWSDPPTSIKHILETLKEFRTNSGYKIKWDKSEALPLNANFHKLHAYLTSKGSPDGMQSNIYRIFPH